jgi:uncharacterized protein (TIGR03067 family)
MSAGKLESVVVAAALGASLATLACFLGPAALAAPAPEARDKKLSSAQALEKMQGTWQVVSIEHDGVPVKHRDRAWDVSNVVVQKDRFVIRGASRREPYVIKVDTRRTPWRIYKTFANPGSPPSRPHPGIFKFEGDRLIILSNQPGERLPNKFDAKCATKFVLRKAKARE